MKNVLKLFLGMFCGLAVSFIFGCIVFQWLTKMSPFENWNIVNAGALSARALSLGAIPNIGVFYLFLNKENYFSARGVIASFILIGLFVIFS